MKSGYNTWYDIIVGGSKLVVSFGREIKKMFEHDWWGGLISNERAFTNGRWKINMKKEIMVVVISNPPRYFEREYTWAIQDDYNRKS